MYTRIMTTKTKVTPETLTIQQVRALRNEYRGLDRETYRDCESWLQSDLLGMDEDAARRICSVLNNAAAQS